MQTLWLLNIFCFDVIRIELKWLISDQAKGLVAYQFKRLDKKKLLIPESITCIIRYPAKKDIWSRVFLSKNIVVQKKSSVKKNLGEVLFKRETRSSMADYHI